MPNQLPWVALCALLLSGCSSLDPNREIQISEIQVEPGKYAKLAAVARFTTSEELRPAIRVVGKHGDASDLRHRFAAFGTEHELLILGLYPDHENTVEIALTDRDGVVIRTRSVSIETEPVYWGLPRVELVTADRARMEPGLTLVSYRGTRNPMMPFIMDSFGDMRWYLDYRGHEELGKLSYSLGMERLRNGNLYFASENHHKIYEIDMLGTIQRSWPLKPLGFEFHHQVLEKPDGNFLATVRKPDSMHVSGEKSMNDFVIEVHRETGQVVREWDLRQVLDETRKALKDRLTKKAINWFHGNSLAYVESDDSIIVSGRLQGVCKLRADGSLVWILAPHKGWVKSRTIADLKPYLLQPLDASGAPITDRKVLDGYEAHADFEWNWGQHATKIMPNGHLILFDNGDTRFWKEKSETYSRAVEFEIDDQKRTVKQVWQFGKERGPKCFSQLTSDVDFIAGSRHVLFCPGWMRRAYTPTGHTEGRVIEVDYATREVVWEARIITHPTADGGFQKCERMPLYPPVASD